MSSCFNLTKWSAEVFLMTADPAFSSYMAELPQCPGLPWCLIQTQVELWLKCSRSAAFYLAPTAPQSPLLFTLYFFFFWGMQFLLIYFLCFFLVCSSFSPCFFCFFLVRLHICSLPAFHLWKLDDTTFSWTWLAVSQLTYGLIFNEHRPISLHSCSHSVSFFAHMSCSSND